MDYPSFSIVMPTFQRREVVCDALRSLTALKYGGDVEIIVVIDGSTDGSAEALAQIAGPFPVRIIKQDNQGASSARNRGASEARGDIILFLDDDMICESDLVEQHARMYRDGADAVIGRTPIDPQSPRGFLPDSVARWIDSACVQTPLSPFDIFTGQLSVRRLVFEELGGFDTALTSGGAFGSEDADFGVRLLAAHDVRYSGSAVSFQRYVVKPREYRDRVDRAVAAHLQFVRRHPHLARDLFDRRGIGGRMVRWVYRPLSGVPFFSMVISRLVVTIAEAGLRTRFRSNRALARFFSAACSLAYWTALRQRGWFPSSNSVLILCYHAIRDEDDPLLARFSIPSKRFELQLESLTNRGFTFISPAQLAAFLDSHTPLPRRPVLLTFDDGYTELLDLAREVLRPRGIEGIAFIVTAAAANEWDQAYGARAIDLMTREQLKELAELGIEIASHSRTHGEMQLMSEAEQEAEAAGSFRDLTHDGLPPPRFFAYPYGASNAESKEAVKSVGFLAAFGLKQSRLQRTSDRFDLPRVIVLAEDGGWRFHAKTAAPRLFNLLIRAQRKLDSIFG